MGKCKRLPESRPARALWIEIHTPASGTGGCAKSRPARALWIEIQSPQTVTMPPLMSRPARALWIEINISEAALLELYVEAREGLVD